MRELSRTPPAMLLDEPPAMELDDESAPVISSEVAAAGLPREVTCFYREGSRGGLTEPL